MKASTLFGLTIALLLALGVVVGARYLGYFDPAPPAEKKAAPEPHLVLVAGRNLFQGTAASSLDAKVRKLTESETEFFEKNKDRLLPPIESAIEARVLAKNVQAGQILFEDQFEKQAFPEAISERLDPGMRSVHLELPKERAAGGLIRVGERVDVLLTSTVHAKDTGTEPFTATAAIARNLKVIVKRDNLWTVMQGVPADKPVTYLVQANPYRAALLEFARLKGVLTLIPTPQSDLRSGKEPITDPDSKEYREEDKRVSAFVNNEHIVSDSDLERIFNLTPRLLPVADNNSNATKVEMMLGTRVVQTVVVRDGAIFSRQASNAANAKTGDVPPPPGPTSELAGAPTCVFAHPDSPVASSATPGSQTAGKSGCKSCQKKPGQ